MVEQVTLTSEPWQVESDPRIMEVPRWVSISSDGTLSPEVRYPWMPTHVQIAMADGHVRRWMLHNLMKWKRASRLTHPLV